MFGGWRALYRTSFQRTAFGIITFEMTGINNHTTNHTGQSNSDNAPIESGRAATARFPAIHPFAEIGVLALDEHGDGWLQQVLFGREELVIREQHGAAEEFGCKIDQLSKIHNVLKPQKDVSEAPPSGSARSRNESPCLRAGF